MVALKWWQLLISLTLIWTGLVLEDIWDLRRFFRTNFFSWILHHSNLAADWLAKLSDRRKRPPGWAWADEFFIYLISCFLWMLSISFWFNCLVCQLKFHKLANNNNNNNIHIHIFTAFDCRRCTTQLRGNNF